MSTIDEVLAAAEVVDAVCVIDGETRIISVPAEYKELGVESDEKVTRVKFQCPKNVGDNIDLTEYNLYINYRNAGNKLNSYLVEDVTVTGDTINFSWLLSRHVTESPGTISYIVCAKKSDDTGVINEWNTKVATGIVGIGLEATEEIEEQNIDAIEQILRSIVELENKVDGGGSGGSSIAIDETLTEQGKAADAKAVGDRLDSLSEEIVTTSESKVAAHNTGTDTHRDIRLLIQGLTDRLNALADSDDTTLDQLSEVVAYIKSNRELIAAITTDKVSVADIIDNLTTNVSNKPLSAAQGVALKALIDTLSTNKLDADQLTAAINTALTQAKESGEFDGAAGHTPIKGTDYWTDDDKAEIVKEVKTELDGVPDYWKSALEAGAAEIRAAMALAGRNKAAFLFYSDVHWNYGSKMSPTLLKYLYRHTGMNKTFFGGDIVNNESTEASEMAYLWDWREQVKDLPNHHSVVGNHDDGNETNNLFDVNYIYGYLMAAEETPDIVRGGDMYYYIDNPNEQTRYIFCDTAYKGVDSTQLDFIKSALIGTPSGWHIVVISHIWFYPDYDQYSVRPIPVGGMDSGAANIVTLLDNYNSRTGNFVDCNGWVEFCIGGHLHRDYDATTETGIPIILVETDSYHIRSDLSATEGTITEASVNGIVADFANKKIYICRIGRGESREITVSTKIVTYTNVIPTAVDTDGTTIYNGVGYKADTRMSGTSGQFKDNAGSCCTGFIPVPDSSGFTVYMKNIVNNTGNNYGCVFYFFTDAGVAMSASVSKDYLESYGYSPVFDNSGNVKQITVPNSEYKYMVVSAVTIDDTSIITINEPID